MRASPVRSGSTPRRSTSTSALTATGSARSCGSPRRRPVRPLPEGRSCGGCGAGGRNCSLAGRSARHNGTVRISAKADYAVRATAELAAAEGRGPVKGEQLAQAQRIPLKFLLNILNELKRARIVKSQRGAEGGYLLARPSDQ